MSTQIFESKLVDETISLTFNFGSRLSAGETISAGGCAVEVFSGVDANPSALLSGAATLDGEDIIQQITGGLEGVVYLISCQADTSDNNVLINQGKVAVLSNNPMQP